MDAAGWFCAIWEEIDRSESYLVCSKYEEAASVASAVLERIRKYGSDSTLQFKHNDEFFQVKESAGMVLVQSLNELGRASNILSELKELFGYSVAIPAEVLLTGYASLLFPLFRIRKYTEFLFLMEDTVHNTFSESLQGKNVNLVIFHRVCFQISAGSLVGIKEFLEDFLSKWIFVDGRFYVLGGAESTIKVHEEGDRRNSLDVETFLAVAEVYAVTLLGKYSKEFDLAISWLEKAALPEENRQVLLRRLHSMYSVKTSNEVHGSSASAENNWDLHGLEGSSMVAKTNYMPDGESARILDISRRKNHPVWWFRCINVKFGNMQVAVTNGKIVVSCIVIFLCYILQKKQAALTRTVRKQVLSIKKSLIDLWQLAFSYQVNPLAAVQPIPAAARPGR
ncbi:Protein APEM9 [Linum perenne]